MSDTMIEKICEQRLADTMIFIVRADTELCSDMLKVLREPGTMSSGATRLFETGWRTYQKTHGAGGVFGVLIHGQQLRSRGPAVMMGKPEMLAVIVEALTLRAWGLTHRAMTPVICEREFEAVINAVAVSASQTAGRV